MYDKELRSAARMAGLSDTLSVVEVIKGSAAETAGIKVGDKILTFAGTTVLPTADAAKRLDKVKESSFVGHESKGGIPLPGNRVAYVIPATSLPLAVERGGGPIQVNVAMDTVCAYNVVALKSDELNAFADGRTVYVTTAMMRFASDDDELATIVSHEIGHNAMRHMDAKKRNALIGGLFGAALDIASAAGGINTGGRYTNDMMAIGSQVFSQDFEREADYVGMYILARARKDYKTAASVWRHIATENPKSIKFATTHPTTAERFVRLEQITQEIDRKVLSNEPLFPQLKK